MQMPKHLSPKFHPVSLGWGPRIYTRVCLMELTCKQKLRNNDDKGKVSDSGVRRT